MVIISRHLFDSVLSELRRYDSILPMRINLVAFTDLLSPAILFEGSEHNSQSSTRVMIPVIRSQQIRKSHQLYPIQHFLQLNTMKRTTSAGANKGSRSRFYCQHSVMTQMQDNISRKELWKKKQEKAVRTKQNQRRQILSRWSTFIPGVFLSINKNLT